MAKLIKAVIVITAVVLIAITAGPEFALTFIGKLFVAAGVAIVSDALAPSANTAAIRQGGLKQELKSSVASRTIVYGSARLGGTIIAAFTSGTDNKYLHLIKHAASHEIESFDQFFINDTAVTVVDDMVISGKYAGKVRILTGLGTADQTADATLVSEITQWTTDHRLRGLAWFAVRFEFDTEVYTQGRPVVTAKISGAKVIDTRTSATEFSNNQALVLNDYLTRGAGSAWDLGCRVPVAELNTTNINAQANICDENVALKGGGFQKRYTCDGRVLATASRDVNIKGILSAAAGQLIYQSGVFNQYAAAAPTVSIQLDDDDLRGPFSLATRRPIGERTNRVIGVFLDATSDLHEENNYPPAVDSAAVTEDGEVFEKRLDLPYTQDPIRAQRIAQIQLRRARAQMSATYPCKMKGIQLQAWSTVGITSGKYGFVAEEFQIFKWNFSKSGGVDLELREHNAAIYAWDESTDEGTPLVGADPTIADGTIKIALTGLSVAAVNLTENGTKIPVLVAAWTAPSALVRSTDVQWKRNADSDWEVGPAVLDPSNPRAVITGLLPAESIDIRVRHVTFFGILGDWVSALDNTVGAEFTAKNTVSVNTRSASDISETIDITTEDGNQLTTETGTPFSLQTVTDVSLELFNVDVSVSTIAIDLAALAISNAALQQAIIDLTSGVSDIYLQATKPVAGVDGIPDPIPPFSRWYDTNDNNSPYYFDTDLDDFISFEDGRIAINANDILNLTGRLDDGTTGLIASFDAIQILDGNIITLDGLITTNATNHTSLSVGLFKVEEEDGSIVEMESGSELDLEPLSGVAVGAAQAAQTLDARVTSSEDDITSQASLLTSLDVEVNGKASSAAFDLVQTTVNDSSTGVTATSEALGLLSSTVNDEVTGLSATALVANNAFTNAGIADGKAVAAAGTANSVSTTVDGHTTTIGEHTTSINGIEGEKTLFIDADGNIAGYKVINGVGTPSEFIILANKFQIVDPDAPDGGGVASPFTVTGGIVTMQNVNITGSLLVSGSVTNTKLGPEAVTTPKIADNAVSSFLGVEISSISTELHYAGWTELDDITVTTTSAQIVKITVQVQFFSTFTSTTNWNEVESRLVRGSSTVIGPATIRSNRVVSISGIGPENQNSPRETYIFYDESPASGDNTYNFQCKLLLDESGGSSARVFGFQYFSISVEVQKR